MPVVPDSKPPAARHPPDDAVHGQASACKDILHLPALVRLCTCPHPLHRAKPPESCAIWPRMLRKWMLNNFPLSPKYRTISYSSSLGFSNPSEAVPQAEVESVVGAIHQLNKTLQSFKDRVIPPFDALQNRCRRVIEMTSHLYIVRLCHRNHPLQKISHPFKRFIPAYSSSLGQRFIVKL